MIARKLSMTDEMTKDRLRVGNDVIAGAYLILPVSQLGRVREVVDRHAVYYWVDSTAISLDGKPATIVDNFGRTGDAGRIQAILDEAG
jgi:hypothetical protein